jgi:hydrogenase/urease accessory protein HupE
MTRLACAIVGTLLLVATVEAHPVSTTTVAVAVQRDGRYVVAITADADPLIAKLEALSTDPLPTGGAPTTEERAARLNALNHALLDHVALAFDGQKMTPTMAPVRVTENNQATIQLTGAAPAGARVVTWASSLVFGSYPLAVRSPDGREVVQWLAGHETSESVILAAPHRALAVGRGMWLGFTHILPNGIDHILFVLGLFLLSTRRAQLLAQVSAFTLAHSITLGLSLYGVFSLPAKIVEPLIALSVAYVGVENLVTSRLHAWRVAIVFAFGLLHGLGFAEALASLHLSRPDMGLTLVSFNAGVEGGQLAVIAIATVAMALIVPVRGNWRTTIVNVSSGAIGLAGLIWTVQRLTL